MAPTPKIFISFKKEILVNSFLKNSNNAIETALSNILYQTNIPSFKVISFPRIAVNPAKSTAMCSWRKAFFMRSKSKKDVRGKAMYDVIAMYDVRGTMYDVSLHTVYFF